MDLSHDEVRPPPTWSCGSKPSRKTAASGERRTGQAAAKSSSRSATDATAAQVGRRRGGGNNGGSRFLCGSRPRQPQQAPTSAHEDLTTETLGAQYEDNLPGKPGPPEAPECPESAKWNQKSQAARTKISETEYKVGTQEWYRTMRAAEKEILDQASAGLPEGWDALHSHSHKGALYYKSRYSGETTWIRPTKPANKVDKTANADSHKCTVHVGGLESFKLDHRVPEYEEELLEAFSQFGEVLQVQVRIRRRTAADGSIKVSWALVTFLSASMAQSAVAGVQSLRRKYPSIVINIVDEKQAQQSKGAMGAVLEKAKAAEQEKLKTMIQSWDGDLDAQSTSSVSFSGTVLAK